MPRPPLATQMAPPVETPAVAEAAAVPPVPQTPPTPPTPAVAATPVAASEPAVERAAAALAAEPAVPAGAAEPAVPAGAPEPSVAPAPRAEEPRAEEQVTVAALPAEPPRPSQASPGEPAGVEFDAGGGTLAVRVFPISGFQGLMRVQDALARVDAVRAATVEAYAQGEARLRLQLGDTTPAGSLAAGLTRRLGQQARVRAASIADRSLLIVLE
jgi:DNA polymerase-3 subunit gamma/tau